MSQIIECAGCGAEMDKFLDKTFPQKFGGKDEYYCRECNKIYPAYSEARARFFAERDLQVAPALRKMRDEFFKKKPVVHDVQTPAKSLNVDSEVKAATQKDAMSKTIDVIKAGAKRPAQPGEIER